MVSRCPLCYAMASRLVDPNDPAYYACPECDLNFIHRQALVDEVEEKRLYSLHQNHRGNVGYVKMLTRFIEQAVEPYAEMPTQGLDFGCGPGPVLSQLLSERGFCMSHYDPYFFPQAELLQQQYGLITATEVFEHLQNPRDELDMLYQLLTEGGVLAVMTQFHHCHNFADWWYRRDPTHICFYSPRTFCWIAQHYVLNLRKLDDKSLCVLQKPFPS